MVLKEIRGNLFSADKKFYFAHCISSDFALGKGIAVQFNTVYDMRNRLRKECGPIGQCPGCVRIDNVYNLITKPRYFNKPTYDSLEQSLLLMKEDILENDIHYLAIPKLGCGLDRLDWEIVKNILENVFKDIDIEIEVYYL